MNETVDQIVVATLNVHGWNDDGGNASTTLVQELAALMRKYKVDVVALQETPRSMVPPLCQALFCGDSDASYVAHSSTALISRFPLTDVTKTDTDPAAAAGKTGKKPLKSYNKNVDRVRHCRSLIRVPSNKDTNGSQPRTILVPFMVVHLDHMKEATRFSQLQTLMGLYPCDNHEYGIWMGDFNALTRQDYSDSQWEDITATRALQSWELPETDVTTFMTSKSGRRQGNEKKNNKNSVKKRDKKGATSYNNVNEGLRLKDAYQEARQRQWLSKPLHTTSDQCKKEPLATCRFQTRIDYIYYPPRWNWTLQSCQHVDVIQLGYSDHNMVVATFVPTTTDNEHKVKDFEEG